MPERRYNDTEIAAIFRAAAEEGPQTPQREVARDEMCKIVQAYSAAEGKWLKFAEAGVASCGIPGEVVNQLKQVHARTEQARTDRIAAAPE